MDLQRDAPPLRAPRRHRREVGPALVRSSPRPAILYRCAASRLIPSSPSPPRNSRNGARPAHVHPCKDRAHESGRPARWPAEGRGEGRVSTRFAVAVVTLASIVAAAATADEAYLLDLEGVVRARVRAPSSAPPAASPVLRLVWVDPTGIGVGAEAAVRAEARSLLRKMGTTVSWRRGDAREMARPGEVRVILLDRTPPASGRPSSAPRRHDSTSPRSSGCTFPACAGSSGSTRAGPSSPCPPRRRAPWRSPWVGSRRTSCCTRRGPGEATGERVGDPEVHCRTLEHLLRERFYRSGLMYSIGYAKTFGLRASPSKASAISPAVIIR